MGQSAGVQPRAVLPGELRQSLPSCLPTVLCWTKVNFSHFFSLLLFPLQNVSSFFKDSGHLGLLSNASIRTIVYINLNNKSVKNWAQLVINVAQLFVCFRMHVKAEVFYNKLSKNLHLCQKLRYFKGSCFSQCFIQSTSPHYSLPSQFLC